MAIEIQVMDSLPLVTRAGGIRSLSEENQAVLDALLGLKDGRGFVLHPKQKVSGAQTAKTLTAHVQRDNPNVRVVSTVRAGRTFFSLAPLEDETTTPARSNGRRKSDA